VDTFFASYFTNYAGNDFTLISTSPARGSGSINARTVDINGTTFGYPPDRGCYSGTFYQFVIQ
jgi:hypothetical protein